MNQWKFTGLRLQPKVHIFSRSLWFSSSVLREAAAEQPHFEHSVPVCAASTVPQWPMSACETERCLFRRSIATRPPSCGPTRRLESQRPGAHPGWRTGTCPCQCLRRSSRWHSAPPSRSGPRSSRGGRTAARSWGRGALLEVHHFIAEKVRVNLLTPSSGGSGPWARTLWLCHQTSSKSAHKDTRCRRSMVVRQEGLHLHHQNQLKLTDFVLPNKEFALGLISQN